MFGTQFKQSRLQQYLEVYSPIEIQGYILTNVLACENLFSIGNVKRISFFLSTNSRRHICAYSMSGIRGVDYLNKVLSVTIINCQTTILVVIKPKSAENLVVEMSSVGSGGFFPQRFLNKSEKFAKKSKNCTNFKLKKILKLWTFPLVNIST